MSVLLMWAFAYGVPVALIAAGLVWLQLAQWLAGLMTG